jgi:ubiquinone/menaquinone biosynthesis C-methylase UbiE
MLNGHRGRLIINRALRLRDLYGLRSFYRPTRFDLDDLVRLNRCFTPPMHSEYGLAARKQRAQARMARMARYSDLTKARLLDVGTGRGELVWAAANELRQSIGVDLDARGLRAAANEAAAWPQTRGRPSFVQSDGGRLPFSDATFDVVASYWAFEHFEGYRSVFAEFGRLLKPGGTAYLEFGPLFYSPLGSHLYRFLFIPWVHLLFDEEVIFTYLRQLGQEEWIDAFKGLNRLTIGGFRQLVEDSRMTVRHWSCQMEPLGRLPQVLRSRLAAYPEEDLRCSNVTCILQKQ